MSDKGEELIQRASEEIKRFGGRTIILQIGLQEFMVMISLMQVGMRHPETAGNGIVPIARSVIDGFSGQLEDYPALREMIAAGFNQDFDTR